MRMRTLRCTLVLFAVAVPALPQSTAPLSPYQPITGGGRIEWAVMNTFNLPSFGVGLISAGWGTYFNEPHEYGVSASGFGKRFGIRLSGIAVQNTMESGLGAVWGEDPRYFRVGSGDNVMHRAGHIVKMTFMARNRDGRIQPAYARYAAIGGSNFLSNAWRADSDATVRHAGIRIGLGFLGRLGVNTYYEFWPDIRDRFFH
jgi:hypothetical protein